MIGQQDTGLRELQWLCCSILRENFREFRHAEIHACFYHYIGLTHTIRRKGSTWIVRISDHCRYAPRAVLEAIIMMLGCKVMHKRIPSEYLHAYGLFQKEDSTMAAVRERRLQKGRKHIAEKADGCYSPLEIYQELNDKYFNNQIEIRRIGWGLRKSRGRLGHYDPVHHTITISPVLDSPGVPMFVVRYIVYHEMLHTVFESASTGGAKRHHPAEFRRAEKAYPDYAKAKRFLREHGDKLHR